MLIGDLCQNVELFLFGTTCTVALTGKEQNRRNVNCCIAVRFSNKGAYAPSVSDAENLSSVSVCKCNSFICTRSSCLSERKHGKGAAVGEVHVSVPVLLLVLLCLQSGALHCSH